MPDTIRIALVEDHAHLRERLLQQFTFFDELDLILVSESGDDFVADLEVRERSGGRFPEVVLMDIEMPGTDGIGTTALVSERWPGVAVLMLTVFEDEDRIFRAIQSGASGYLLKDAGTDAIVHAIKDVAAGGAPTSPLVARKLLEHVRSERGLAASAKVSAKEFALTPREREVLDRLVDDETEAAMAKALGISSHTIRSHVKNIYSKLQVHSRAQAVRLALETRLV